MAEVELTYAKAICEAMSQKMREDPDVFLMGVHSAFLWACYRNSDPKE